MRPSRENHEYFPNLYAINFLYTLIDVSRDISIDLFSSFRLTIH